MHTEHGRFLIRPSEIQSRCEFVDATAMGARVGFRSPVALAAGLCATVEDTLAVLTAAAFALACTYGQVVPFQFNQVGSDGVIRGVPLVLEIDDEHWAGVGGDESQQDPIQSLDPEIRVSPSPSNDTHVRMVAMARQSGKPGPDPQFTLVPKRLWLSEAAKTKLDEIAKERGLSAGRFVTALLARETGVPEEELLRDLNQRTLKESA
ncbi:hypothetical protein [Nocardia salmonicida]|uniref:hypothetical protein n=1 Tax=Nocardia salmonicida TaxID=53431 RepID=UPI0007A44061|nr:hypothetical protein [Nocardia salmonicida]